MERQAAPYLFSTNSNELFLFTNQSGIGRGYFKHADAEACNRKMIELLGLGDDVFADICIAPEHPSDPPQYRKPSPRFILESIDKYHLASESCYMVGDRASDWQAGINAGIKPIAVRCGVDWKPDSRALIKRESIPVYDSITEFVDSLEA